MVVTALPVFPLPNAVLLPGELLPLHVFEPRYRAMIAACMAEDRLLGIATLRPGWERADDRRPAVWPELGMGRIAEHRPLPDGRSNILVSFVAAGQIEAELPTVEPFRRVQFVPYPEIEADGGDVSGLRALAVQALARAGVREVDRLVRGSDEVWMDGLARAIFDQPEQRRAWLRARRTSLRVALLQEVLLGWLMADEEAHEA